MQHSRAIDPAASLASIRGRGPVAWAARRGIHYGWIVVAATFLIVVTAAGVRSTSSVLIKPLEADFGWSRGQVSLALSVSLVFYGLAAPLSGRLIDRYGMRGVVSACLLLTAIGTAFSATLARLGQLHIFWGVIVGLGTGGAAVVLSATVATAWFDTRRGLVTGVLGGASSAGQLLFLPLILWLKNAYDWRVALATLAVLMGGVVLPTAVLLLRSRPSDVGLTAYGAGTATTSVTDTRVTLLRDAARTGDFWLLASTFFICGFTTVGFIGTHFIPHATERGFSEAQAAGILSVIGGMNVVGTIASGWLCDRVSPRKLLAVYYVGRALALLVLPLITTLPMMAVFAVIYGFDYIATVPPTVMITADRFGRRSVGSIFGWITFSHMLGGALAAYLVGAIHDITGNYGAVIYISGTLALLAAAMAINIRRRTPIPALSMAGD